MATKIRGITIELGADTSGIEKGLKDVNKDLKATQNELKDVDKLLKLDPKNTELLKQKQELLGKAIGQTKDKLETLKKAEKEAENQFKQGKISEDQYRAIKREVAETEGALKKLGDEAQTANKKLSNVPETMNKIADKARTVANKTKVISGVAAGLLTALGAGVYKTVQSADEISSLSQKSGISTERIQEYNYAADLLDVSTDSIVKAQQKLKKNMASSSDSTVAAFQKLGVKTRNLSGQLRDSNDVFDEVIAALSKITNETERDNVAMELLGKGADELAGLIDDGGAAFKELAKEAHEAGAVLSQDSLDALNRTNDALDTLKNKASAALGQVAEKLINNPKFDDFLDKTTDFLDKFIGYFAEMPLEKIETIVGILAGTAAISPLASMIGGVATAIGQISTALAGSSAAGGLVAAIGGAGGLTAALFAVAAGLGVTAALVQIPSDHSNPTTVTPDDTISVSEMNKFEKYRYDVLKENLGMDFVNKRGGGVDPMEWDTFLRYLATHFDESKTEGIPWAHASDGIVGESLHEFEEAYYALIKGGAIKSDEAYEALKPNKTTTPGSTRYAWNVEDGVWVPAGKFTEPQTDNLAIDITFSGNGAILAEALEPTITAERVRRGQSFLNDVRLGLTW